MTDPGAQAAEILGQEGEGCRSCGAPLAVDQRYCLNCGQRRAGPRVDFRRHLPGQEQAPAAAQNGSPPAAGAAEAPGNGKPERDYTPLAAVGGIAVLGLMLLVGVLIGKENGSSTNSTPAPVVLQKGAAGEEGGGETTADAGAGAAKEKAPKAAAPVKPAKKAEDASALTTGGGGGGPVEANDKALEELESGGNYSENSAKLPDEIATEGAPPPEDNKAPGGGSKGTAIE